MLLPKKQHVLKFLDKATGLPFGALAVIFFGARSSPTSPVCRGAAAKAPLPPTPAA